jgi:hypothetical protein
VPVALVGCCCAEANITVAVPIVAKTIIETASAEKIVANSFFSCITTVPRYVTNKFCSTTLINDCFVFEKISTTIHTPLLFTIKQESLVKEEKRKAQ